MILLDGSFGTCLWGKAEQKGIEKVAPWIYNLTAPEMVKELNMEYFRAGTRIIETNTFSVNADSLKGTGHTVEEVISAAVKIAKDARKEFDPQNKEDIKISLDIGPLARYLDPIGNLTKEEAAQEFSEVINAGIKAGVDQIFLETFTDLKMMEIAARIAMETGKKTFVSFSYDERGRTLVGDYPADIAKEMAGLGVDAIGVNCGAGPSPSLIVIKQYTEALDAFSKETGIKREELPKLLLKPNVDEGVSPEAFSLEISTGLKELGPAITSNLEYIGACCGSNPDYIKALS